MQVAALRPAPGEGAASAGAQAPACNADGRVDAVRDAGGGLGALVEPEILGTARSFARLMRALREG